MYTSREIAEAIAYHQDRRTSIYNSLYAAVMGLVPDVREHPGHDDVVVSREDARRLDERNIAHCDRWLSAIRNEAVQS